MRIARFTTGEDPQFGVVTGEVDEHGMPLRSYLWLHPEARLTDAERKVIVDWANAAQDAVAGAAQ